MPLTKGKPSITDLSEARFGDSKHTDRIMPNVYRAPEVILGVPWSHPIDVWGFGMVVSLLICTTMTFTFYLQFDSVPSESRLTKII